MPPTPSTLIRTITILLTGDCPTSVGITTIADRRKKTPAASLQGALKSNGNAANSCLLAGEVVDRDWVFEQGIIPRHDRDSALGDEVSLAVSLGVVSDGRALGDMH